MPESNPSGKGHDNQPSRPPEQADIVGGAAEIVKGKWLSDQPTGVQERRWAFPRTMRQLRERESLRKKVQLDAKTQLPNYPTFTERVRKIVEGTARTPQDPSDDPEKQRIHKNTFSLLLIDIDDFKQLNDVLGYTETDRQALLPVAEEIRTTGKRASDTQTHVARFGGEEFMVFLDGADAAGALLIAQDLHARLNAINYTTERGEGGHLGATIAIATGTPGGITYEEFAKRAEKGLKAGKEIEGKNQIMALGPRGEPQPQPLTPQSPPGQL